LKDKKCLVLFSGGMDSSICLQLAKKKWGVENVLALSFSYHQRHSVELEQAEKIAALWKVDHKILQIDTLREVSNSALIGREVNFEEGDEEFPPNTMVVGRNGLMLRLAAIYGYDRGVIDIFTGVMELEEANSGYRDCSRKYIDLMQEILRLDLGTQDFFIQTPLVKNTKKENMYLAYELGVLNYLLEETVTCYEGLKYQGCGVCPACVLRNPAIVDFQKENPNISLPYAFSKSSL
jgi:7-cyano-7-deazaguanine synthase